METKEILNTIKNSVHQILPDAIVMLFGSRASNTANEESDWDILVIDKYPVSRSLQRKVRNHLFPLSLQLSTLIHTIVVNENDCEENPSYYSLRQSVLCNPVLS